MQIEEEVRHQLQKLLIMVNDASYQRLDGEAICSRIVALQWVLSETDNIFQACQDYKILK
jgi:hypothetical protein